MDADAYNNPMDRTVLVVAAALTAWLAQPRPLFREIERTTDVAWLERLCTDRAYAETEYAQRGFKMAGTKGNRSLAYMRLGALGTAESLAAITRIETLMHQRSVLPQPAVPAAPLNLPAPHMTDFVWRPAAVTRFEGGREIAAYVLTLYGPPTLFLAVRSANTWSAPLMIPVPIPYGDPPRIAMSELPRGRLRVGFSAPDSQTGVAVYAPTPDAVEVTLAEVERDTDGDGWTDILERALQMHWFGRDSDLDGIPDDRDDAPSFKESPRADDEDARILRRSIFAMFGFTESPGALFVADTSRRLQPDGLPGPVFYQDGNGGVRVTWKILEKTADTATVEITDFENALAGSGNDIRLRKIDNDWYVVAIVLRWIS